MRRRPSFHANCPRENTHLRLPASLKPLPDTKHIDPKDFAREMLELQRKQKAAAGPRPSMCRSM
ncbi:MAG: hypothetical protein WA733_21935 [Methylocystis sp.]